MLLIATSKTVIANIGTIGSPMGFTKSSTTSETSLTNSRIVIASEESVLS